jgi:hypothetical protein
MKKICLFAGFLLAVHVSFAQPWTTSPGLYIPFSHDSSSALFIQGQTAVDANFTMEGIGNAQIFWLTAGNNVFKIGGVGGTEPAMGVINIDQNGNVGVNTLNTAGYKFAVAGTAVFTEAVVKLQANWPDYVFHSNYHLPSLSSVAAYIKANNHLPGLPSSAEVAEKGIDLGATQAKLLEKIEQLTLYVIDLKKENEEIRAQLKVLSDNAR